MSELPLPSSGLHHALGAWRSWLAARGFGLVPIADPSTFQWAGWWIAVGRPDSNGATTSLREIAVLAFGTPPGIVLSPQDAALLGHATAELNITAAYAVASLDPVLRDTAPTTEMHGTVEALAIAPAAEAGMQLVDIAQARAGHGLEGDRYAAGVGTFSPRAERRPGYDLTLSPPRPSTGAPLMATSPTSLPPVATCSLAASTSTPSSAAPSASATCFAKDNGCANRALISSNSAGLACCDPSYTKAACARTSSPTESYGLVRPSALCDLPKVASHRRFGQVLDLDRHARWYDGYRRPTRYSSVTDTVPPSSVRSTRTPSRSANTSGAGWP